MRKILFKTLAKWLHVKGRFLLLQWAECSKRTCSKELASACALFPLADVQMSWFLRTKWALLGSDTENLCPKQWTSGCIQDILPSHALAVRLRAFAVFWRAWEAKGCFQSDAITQIYLSRSPNTNESRISSMMWPSLVIDNLESGDWGLASETLSTTFI